MKKQKKTTPLRDRDILVIKIVDWSDDPKDCEPAIDVEVYLNGEFDIDKSKIFSINEKLDKFRALELARSFATEVVRMERLTLVR